MAEIWSNSTPPTSASSPESSADSEINRILIAYFSRTDENISVGYIEKGNTEIIAEMISAQIGGTLFHIETVKPYPEKYDDYKDVTHQEKNDNARPELTGSVENMANYDAIFLGYPIWWGDMPMAVYTFLDRLTGTNSTARFKQYMITLIPVKRNNQVQISKTRTYFYTLRYRIYALNFISFYKYQVKCSHLSYICFFY